MQMAKRFGQVHAFEPMATHRECFRANLAAQDHVFLHECALSDREGTTGIHTTPGSSGDTYVEGEGDIPLRTLDSFNLTDVDFIKADTEGHELAALRGGEQTIIAYRPTIIVEQKPGRAQRHGYEERGALEYLRALGYRLVKEISGDFILVPNG
jgi:FkbM family methyltransferase